MPESSSFRQVDEKHVSAEVACMVWSPKMDLIAVANVHGEVVLHRLSWQKVWNLAPPAEEVKVTALAWRPDGKVLSVGYSSSKVVLCDVENASVLHTINMAASITSLAWVAETPGNAEAPPQGDCFVDISAQVLPKLIPFTKSYGTLSKGQSDENVEDAKRLKGQTDLNILLVGTSARQLYMYAYGVFPTGRINLDQADVSKEGDVLSAWLSQDLRLLSILVEAPSDNTASLHRRASLVSFDTTLLASRHDELRILALKFGQVLTLMQYLEATIQQMCEAWEDVLLEMDSKLLKFAEEKYKQSGGTVSNDFLRLLMFGIPSDGLHSFLLHDLTGKGLKKLGHSIETSYSNIQKLVLKHLQSVGTAIVYHLSDLHGMSLWYHRFGVLGLSTQTIQQAISVAGSFMVKASELQQVIDGSMKNFKAFFRWLYVVIQRLSDETVPAELTKMTQQDFNFVAEFLKDNFTQEMDGTKSGFKLEKVGQYLKNEDLLEPPDNSTNPWVQFLQENPAVKDGPLLYTAQPNKSLIQMHQQLVDSINAALAKSAVVIGQSLQSTSSVDLFTFNRIEEDKTGFKSPRVTQMSVSQADTQYIYTLFSEDNVPCAKCYLLRQTTNSNSIEAVAMTVGEIGQPNLNDSSVSSNSHRCIKHNILDVSFYDSETVSLLLEEVHEDGLPVLLQVPMATLAPHCFVTLPEGGTMVSQLDTLQCIDVGPQVENVNCRRLDNMKASKFTVSGTRKVACVLFSSRRRVRLFLMDAEDEDDEEEEEEEEEDRCTEGQLADTSTVSQDTSAGTQTEQDEDDEDKENTSRDSVGMDL